MKEVYIAYGENNEVLYVGQGNIGRHKHCLSGTSHCRELNRYYVVAEKFFVKNGKNTRGYKVISTISEKDLTDKATIE